MPIHRNLCLPWLCHRLANPVRRWSRVSPIYSHDTSVLASGACSGPTTRSRRTYPVPDSAIPVRWIIQISNIEHLAVPKRGGDPDEIMDTSSIAMRTSVASLPRSRQLGQGHAEQCTFALSDNQATSRSPPGCLAPLRLGEERVESRNRRTLHESVHGDNPRFHILGNSAPAPVPPRSILP